ncbi:2-amino-3,7-dideoxy-D-threo-hept-6-ulosonate synthase [Actinomadura flavalba]|uniref:2-amino-3,7-dideoxy-D-threo-hept-6-ulosonate synthase n=1 Tax=Actinomadura flavalba TaxID=1120938 RepID=UPI000362F061|nr:2-amino-3,7-dideoxy-D-threo-hept-6-ulosonate synthase [Actinomadura flavalba]
MTEHTPFGTRLRLSRLGTGDGRMMIVPLDHSVTDGPLDTDASLDGLVGVLAGNGVDAVVLHKGAAKHVDPAHFADMALIVHLSASTAHAPDPDAKYLVASIEAALRLGADAVSVHVNIGSREEAQQVADFANVAESCDRWNLPLLAMMYARGPNIDDPKDVEILAHAVTLAADLGADVVKIPHPGDEAGVAELVRACPAPLVMAGGPQVDDTDALCDRVSASIAAGAAGVAMGRNVFAADDPAAVARRVSDAVHQPARRFAAVR